MPAGRPKGSRHKKLCGAKLRKKNRTCRNAAGARTDHKGYGRCWLHEGRPPTHGLYSEMVRHPRIKDLLEKVKRRKNPTDLLEPLALLNTLTIDFVNRYEEMSEALLAWHSELRTIEDWEEWAELEAMSESVEVHAVAQAVRERARRASKMKPRVILDITAAAKLIDKIGKLVGIIERQRQSGVISVAAYHLIMEQMALAVLRHVKDRQVRERIGDAWEGIKVIE